MLLMNKYQFPCSKCGMCCRNLSMSSLYNDLHDGSGICRHLNTYTNLCTIYNDRPEKCNITDAYQHFKNIMSFDKYIQLNIESCKKLKGD